MNSILSGTDKTLLVENSIFLGILHGPVPLLALRNFMHSAISSGVVQLGHMELSNGLPKKLDFISNGRKEVIEFVRDKNRVGRDRTIYIER